MLQYLPLLAVLACPVTMGVMMWMMRGRHAASGESDATTSGSSTQEEVAILRAEIALLREQHARRNERDSVDHPAR